MSKEEQNLEKLVDEINVPVLESTIITESNWIVTGPVVYGGSTPQEMVKDYKTEIKIKHDKIDKIIFDGLCYLEKGDIIHAYILKADGEIRYYTPEFPFEDGKYTFYTKRDFKKEEKAFKIEKLKEEKVVITYLDKRGYNLIYWKK